MLQSTYTFEELKMSSQLVRDLIAEKDEIKPLVNSFFSLENLREQVDQKTLDTSSRQVLVAALKEQNLGLDLSEKTKSNIDLLQKDSTFTITTGHQLNLLTGPLYSLYKVAQVISLCERAKKMFEEFDFVPVFWMATEDHDYEEINHLNLFGQKVEWLKEGQENVIAGRIDTTAIEAFTAQIEEKFQDPKAASIVQELTAFYEETPNLAAATRAVMNHLFGEYGVVIIDGDDKGLKSLYAPMIHREVKEQLGYSKVMQANEALEKLGYHQQVYVREINFFYINERNERSRLKFEDGKILREDIDVALDDLLQDIEVNPDNYSPNALFRPLYQERILPNLAYVGGGGEIAYWLQLKPLFDAYDMTFPLLRVRDSILVHQSQDQELMTELDLELMDIKLGVDEVVKNIALANAEEDLNLDSVRVSFEQAKTELLDKVLQVEPNLKNMVDAEFAKMEKTLERIEAKLVKAEKGKHEKVQKKLVRLRGRFFPNNGFQERSDNFIPFYLKDDQFVDKILTTLKAENSPLVRLLEM